jgi:hypothetical protein
MLVVLIADEDSEVFGDWQELSSGCCYTLKSSEKCCLGGARDGHETTQDAAAGMQQEDSTSPRQTNFFRQLLTEFGAAKEKVHYQRLSHYITCRLHSHQ